ncbi:Sodium/potassium-transporting ATPase subunit beta-1 [Orchesella cincta]|uniref:Sodium/potassium-transporting ATPase subunit beta-1 n=1 Tax=Orchesella cincta TaxID=48709 RepID=A0A1D2N9Z6_ORCCI|nr:Sodium/potassium-transporting ATPase subunit beta-1 [Orchesella cincta]
MSEEETKTVKPSKSRGSKAAPMEGEPETTVQPVEEDGGWRKFIWNEDKREFLGRTGKSWLLIFIFYVIFFISLFAFFMLNWYLVLTLTVSDKKPTKIGDTVGSMLFQDGPGLALRPRPDRHTNAAASLLWFSVGSYENFRYWKNQLSSWFYNIPKPGAPDTIDCKTTGVASDDESCLVPVDQYGACQPLLADPSINTITDFGYARGEPCLLLKLNRIYDWMPKGDCTGDCLKQAPKDLQEYMTANKANINEAIYVWCQGMAEHDKENLGSIEYFPGPYIRKNYFPFKNQQNYQSPFVMVQLKRPLAGALLSIECQAYDDNIVIDDNNKAKRVGYTKFELLID